MISVPVDLKSRLISETGQLAIITGAAQGIGAETAMVLAREGCKVVIADIDAGPALLEEDVSPHSDPYPRESQ